MKRIKFSNKKILVRVILGITILFIGGIIGFNLFINSLISKADMNLNIDEFDKAKQYYQMALKYNVGKDEDIQSKIQRCDNLQSSFNSFNEGTDLLETKKFLEAITAFEGVIPEDEKRFNVAKDKIVESGNLYLESKFGEAEAFKSKNDYTVAIATVESILDFAPNNEKAETLLAQYEADLESAKNAAKAKEEAEKNAQNNTQSKGVTEETLRAAVDKFVRRGLSDDEINEWLGILSSRYGYKVDNLYR